MTVPIPMPVAANADPMSYPLIAQLFDRHGFVEVTSANFAAFSERQEIYACHLFSKSADMEVVLHALEVF